MKEFISWPILAGLEYPDREVNVNDQPNMEEVSQKYFLERNHVLF